MTSSMWESKLPSEIQTLAPPSARHTKDHLRVGQPPTKSSNRSTHTPYPNPLIRKNTPVMQHQPQRKLSPQNQLLTGLRPGPLQSCPPLTFGSDKLLSHFWSKLIAFIFQPDMALMIPGLSGEFYQVSPRLSQHPVFPHGLRI